MNVTPTLSGTDRSDHWAAWTPREWLAFGLTGLLVLVVNLGVVWVPDWLPLSDLGGHVELLDIAARLDDPNTAYPEFYTGFDPMRANTIGLVIARLAGDAIPAWTLARALLSFYVIGVPLGLLAIARAWDRSPWLAVLGAPTTFNAVFLLGFLNFLVALPLLLFSLALARRIATRAERWPEWLLAGILVLLFLTHVLAFLITIAMVAFMIVLHARRWTALLRAWPLLVPAPLIGRWIWLMFFVRESTEAGRTFITDDGLELVFVPFSTRIQSLHGWGMSLFRNHAGVVPFAIITIVWLALLWHARRSRRSSEKPDAAPTRVPRWLAWMRTHDLQVVTLCCAIAYFSLPSHMHEMAIIHQRVWILVLWTAVIWPTVAFRSTLARALLIPIALTAVLYPLYVTAQFQRFSRDVVDDLPEMIDALPEKSQMLVVQSTWRNPVTWQKVIWHLPKSIHATRNGGITHDSFALRVYTPIQYQEGMTPRRFPWDPPFVAKWTHLPAWDYVLAYVPDAEESPVPERPWISNIGRAGDWWMYEVHATENAREMHREGRGAPHGGR